MLIQAARETGALQAAKNKLEKQVEDLTLRLQLEKRMRVSYFIRLCVSFRSVGVSVLYLCSLSKKIHFSYFLFALAFQDLYLPFTFVNI